LLFSCKNEKCTNLKINKRYDLVSGVLIGDTLLTTVSALDTIVGHSYEPNIVGFNLRGDSLFTKKSNAGVLKNENKIFSYNYLPSTIDGILIYNSNIDIEATTNHAHGLLSLHKPKIVRKEYSVLGVIISGEAYFELLETRKDKKFVYNALRKSSYKEYNQTSFQGFAGDSHVYNDTLYVEDKCFCIEKGNK
jgi:hypothetical protein